MENFPITTITVRHGKTYRGAVVDSNLDMGNLLDSLSEQFDGSIPNIEEHLVEGANPFVARMDQGLLIMDRKQPGDPTNSCNLWVIEKSGVTEASDGDIVSKWRQGSEDELVLRWANTVAQDGFLSRDAKLVLRFAGDPEVL